MVVHWLVYKAQVGEVVEVTGCLATYIVGWILAASTHAMRMLQWLWPHVLSHSA